MSIIQTVVFYSVCWFLTWAIMTLVDRRRIRSPNLTYSEQLALAEERIPALGWIGGWVFFLILIVIVPFVGFAADLT